MVGRATLRLLPGGRTFEVESGSALEDILFSQGVEFPCGGMSLCGRCRVRVVDGQLAVTPEMRTVLTEDEIARGWRLACHARLQESVTLEVEQWEGSILSDEAALPFEPADGLGIAIDLGTTTLVTQAVDLATGEVLAVSSGLNPQAAHGADVMSRIQFALAEEAGAARLMHSIRDALGAMVQRVLTDCGRARAEVRKVLIAGNTVMHHLFCGLSVEPLSHVPFAVADAGMRTLAPSDLGWDLDDSCPVQFLPCLGGFVGSDLVAGIVACSLDTCRRPVALIDLGTNGEIILTTPRGILCASTAAGPAFEGGGIRKGMRAGTGAIARVRAHGSRLECGVIGGGPPAGICGSGLVDAIAAGLESGLIQPDGRLAGAASEFPLAGSVSLSRRDIRELQLAKAAIASGLRLLAGRAGLGLEEIAEVHLAGAFGNYIDIASAHRIGLIEIPPARILPVGNTSLRGTRKLLLSPSQRAGRIEAVVSQCVHVPLASESGFQECFVDCLAFPPALQGAPLA